jgi:hypothetical protein
MSELVADCPRCGAQQITFDLTQDNITHTVYNWQRWFEAFCVCRHCNKATIFVLSQKDLSSGEFIHKNGLVKFPDAVNKYMNIEGYINLKEMATTQPPEHLPEDIEAAFREGAACMAIECFNAAGTMFRLCIDLATKSKLPEGDANGLNANIRRNLGLRLPWLFDNNLLPNDLRELSSCVRDDGNDGAHVGSLSEEDAEDLLDFTCAILERIYTEPERLKIAKDRREARRGKK